MSQMPAECEICNTTVAELKKLEPAQTLRIHMTMWMCPVCLKKETDLQEKSKAEADVRVQDSRALQNQLAATSRALDGQIQLREDMFNAHTIDIMELERAILADETIGADVKTSTLAEELSTRYKKLAQVVHDAREMLIDAGNQQRAIQTYMNTLSNKLREDEREKYKLQDLNYTVERVIRKSTKAPGKQPKKQAPMSAVKEAAAKYGVPVDVVKIRLIMKHGETPEQAALEVAKKLGLYKKGE